MSKKIELKSELDLIEIYQKGQWEEFCEKYGEYLEETNELYRLLDEFSGDYFLEYNVYATVSACTKGQRAIEDKYVELTGDKYVDYKIDAEKNLEWQERRSMWEHDSLYRLSLKERARLILGDSYESNTNIFSDSRIERLEYLSKKWLRYDRYKENNYKLIYLNEELPLDSERLEFAKKFFRKRILTVEFDNTIEEAIDYNLSEVKAFLEKNKRYNSLYSKYNLYKYLGKKLKRLRLNANLSEKELADRLNLFDDPMSEKNIKMWVKKIESGSGININLLIKYADYFNIKLDDIIGHNSVMEELVRRQKEMEFFANLDEEFLDNEKTIKIFVNLDGEVLGDK